MKRLLCALLALSVLISAAPCMAAEAQPTSAPVDKAHSEYVLGQVLRGVDWDMTMEQVAQVEQVKLAKKPKSVVVKDITLFDMSVPSMEYIYKDDIMVSREFMFSMKVDFSLIFYAIYYFYGSPNYNTKKSYTWEKEDMQIVLVKAKNSTVTFTVRRPKTEPEA